ncbi:class III extradiol dioxygenase subunit B-like domain-containing protein [Streptomyces sp. NPDC012623]|uniref:class III extradiol dioxygenase subunit B-like domain-containing protein n=1 Tax=unclassified Streptomyces TaxID=2593676 RepID=UPI0036C0AF72
MLVSAAVCPSPPLLVPALAAGAAPELDSVRAACVRALGALAAARPDRLVVVGPAAEAGLGIHPQGAVGSFRDFGVDVDTVLGGVRDGAGPGPGTARELPASLAVAAWLLEHARWRAAPVSGLGVAESLAPEDCARAGRELATEADRVALLVMGDGSACRSVKAPGYLDERAPAFDAAAAQALAAVDVAGLLALETEPARALKAAGRAPWQVLAGAAQGGDLAGELLYEGAPYGVGYFVALWS